jgi:hypothetical protein
MIYNTGTIAINGNTATGTGTNWTAPASQVRAGQTIIVMSNPVQMFQISAVNSSTSMTVTPAASPALNGQKYGILVSDNISVDGLAQAMSQLIKDYDENIGAWESFASTSSNQNVTVTINGVSVTIPAIGKLLQKGSNGALPVNQGGTGATNKEDARTNLGLGDSAMKTVGTATGNVMLVGAFGLGVQNTPYMDATGNSVSSLLSIQGAADHNPAGTTGVTVLHIPQGSYGSDLAMTAGGKARGFIRTYGNYQGGTWSELYSTGNTTKTSDGTLKAASPVVQINHDGGYQINDESEGCTVARLGVGQYLIEGCMGMNADAAWGGKDGGFEIPTDRNKQPLIWLDYEVNPNGSVLVKTYHRSHPGAPAFARNEKDGVSDGDPFDIPRDQFVSVRVEMPADSLYNQRMRAAVLTMTNDEGE